MNTPLYFKERFDKLQQAHQDNGMGHIRQTAFNDFNRMGIPTTRHEEWKYTRISSLFDKEYQFPGDHASGLLSQQDLNRLRLPGHEKASELFFIDGLYSPGLSIVRSKALVVLPLEEAAQQGYRDIVSAHFGHSGHYLKDGINALNTAFVQGAVFIHVKKEQATEVPVYIYNITDAGPGNIFAQPRSLVYLSKQARLQLVETYATIGVSESFTNQVMEIIVEEDAMLEYYKIQNDGNHASQVSTTHIHQVGKSNIHTVTVSLNGGMVRNNLDVVLDAEHSEAHMYGLYLQNGNSHIDNHTIADHVKPHCYSNEFYKGILDGSAAGVFNGKIFVRPDAQKTNAYQSNKNILLSDTAVINTKPQLEIFADDVKCSHGCTVGRLNEEGLFYLQSRGINEKTARSLLLQAFTADILEQVRPVPLREYMEQLISTRFAFQST